MAFNAGRFKKQSGRNDSGSKLICEQCGFGGCSLVLLISVVSIIAEGVL